MKISRRTVGITVALACAVLVVFVYTDWFGETQDAGAVRSKGHEIPVEVALAEVRRVERRAEAVGTTLARQAVEIVPLASGRVTEILFEPGDRVEAGAALVRLDDEIERADLAEAEANLVEAVQALKRARALRQNNAVAETTVQELTAKEAAARAEVDRARRRLDDRTILAPFAGTVGLARVEPGARVDNDTVITTLDDLSQIEIEFALPELLYGQVLIGQSVVADSAAFLGRHFEGRIIEIDSRISAASRAFKARALVPNPDSVLPAGMFMHLAVVLESRDAAMIPEQAILAQGGENFVFVVNSGTARRRAVSIGVRQYGSVEISDGLSEGEMVVTAGLQRVRDGAAVRVVGGDRSPTVEPNGLVPSSAIDDSGSAAGTPKAGASG